MSVSVHELAFKLADAPISSRNGCYRPPHWPPPADWIVSEGAQGSPLSRWGDDHWDFSPWAGQTFKLDFAGGKNGNSAAPLSPENQHFVRLLATWMIWGPHGPRAWSYLKTSFKVLRRIAVLCEKEGIRADELVRLPRVIEQIPRLLPTRPDRITLLTNLDRLLRAKEEIGFALLDDEGLTRLARAFSESPIKEESEQTAYIPPRIWVYQVTRLRACLDDFLKHSDEVVSCYNFCVDAYVDNFGSLENALTANKKAGAELLPFGANDARWPASPSVEVAVKAAAIVARLRMRCAAANPVIGCTAYDKENPLLLHAGFEPWGSQPRNNHYSIGIPLMSYRRYLKRFPRVFDSEILKITEEDLGQARMFTPNLDKGGAFNVGKTWPLASHQLRRTGGINMFASGVMSDSSIQVIMKHLTLFQTSYYGRNHSRLRFSEEFEGINVAAKYEVLAKQIQTLVEDRYVSPLGEQRKQEIVVNLVAQKDYKTLVKAGKKGEVSFRETRLGGCTKLGHCEYGGIESVARCAGGDGDKPCRDAIFDKAKRPSVERQLRDVEGRIAVVQAESPRERALRAEAQGLRKYLDAIN